MGRYIKDIELNQPLDVVSLVMEDYIYHNRFQRTDWNGEMVFCLQDGHGRERYLKWSYAGGVYHVEAWLKGAFGKERDLDGIGKGASGREFRESIDRLEVQLKHQQTAGMASGHVGADPLHHSTDYQAEHQKWKEAEAIPCQGMPSWQRGHNGQTAGDRTAGQAGRSGQGNLFGNQGIYYGILGILFGIWFPVVGILCGVMGVKRSQGVGKVLCMVAFAISVLEIVVYVLFFIVYSATLL